MPIPEAMDAELLGDLQKAALGEYDILGVLGRGGMGLVYLAHDIRLNRKVAIKVLPPELLRSGAAAVERFRREAQIAASLRHPHITAIHGLRESSRLLYFVMEYVEGCTLGSVLEAHGRLTVDEAKVVILDVAGALGYAHQRGVTHRDIKPGNIILHVDGMAVVTDFGVAKLASADGLTSTGATVGSPRYMSPEQWSGQATPLSDQYAVGTVCYEMLAGAPPFRGETVEQLMKQQLLEVPRSIRELRPDCPAGLVRAVMRMLEKEPEQRWPSLNDALAAMEIGPVGPGAPVRRRLVELARSGHAVRSLPRTPASPIPLSRATQKPAKRSVPLRTVGGAAAAVLAIGLVAYLASRPSPSSPRPAAPPARSAAGDAAIQVEVPRSAPAARVPRRRETTRTSPPAAPAVASVRAAPGVLRIIVTPVWAYVSIDGSRRGSQLAVTDTLASGVPHRLRFERDGFVTVDTVVTLRPAQEYLLKIQMIARAR